MTKTMTVQKNAVEGVEARMKNELGMVRIHNSSEKMEKNEDSWNKNG